MQLQWFVVVFASIMGMGCGALGSAAFYEVRNKLPGATAPTVTAALISIVVGAVACVICLSHLASSTAVASPGGTIIVGAVLCALTLGFATALARCARDGATGGTRKVLAVLAGAFSLAFSLVSEYVYLGPALTMPDGFTFPLACTMLGLVFGMTLHMTIATYTVEVEELSVVNTPLMVAGAAAAACVIVAVMAGGYNEVGSLAWGVSIIFGGVGPGTMSWLVSNGMNELTGNISTPSWAAFICALGGTAAFHIFVWIALLGGSSAAFFAGVA